MAATNRPAALDEALTRPGRFDRMITLPLPNYEVGGGVGSGGRVCGVGGWEGGGGHADGQGGCAG